MNIALIKKYFSGKKKIFILLISTLLILLGIIGYWKYSITPSETDVINVSEIYLNDLNKRIFTNEKYHLPKEVITKQDVEILDNLFNKGTFSTSSPKVWITPQTEKQGGMVGFSPREQKLFDPQIRTLRLLCKDVKNKDYCKTIFPEVFGK